MPVLPHEAIVVEDSVPGIRSALGAGIQTIAVGPPERLVGDLQKIEADGTDVLRDADADAADKPADGGSGTDG